MIPPWLILLFMLAFIMLLSKYELGIVLIIGTLIFALVAQVSVIGTLFAVFLDPSIILLAVAVAIIPLLGGVMEESGLMMELVEKMSINKKASLMIAPALFGLLPVAGGALMSAPIVDEIEKDLDPNLKVAINVWFRHLLILIYPLSTALIFASYLAGISLYILVLYLLIPFFIMGLIGYLLFLRSLEIKSEEYDRDLKRVFRNLSPLLLAPLIDFIGRTFFEMLYPELFLVVGLCLSLALALRLANMAPSNLKKIAAKVKLWRFPVLILAMFWFLEVFIRSGVSDGIGTLNLQFLFFICLGFFLGFATGRIQVPLSILIPIYLFQFGLSAMLILDFVFIYCAIFLGYLLTPIHPCVAYSINFFETNYKRVFRYLAVPTFICFGLLVGVYFCISLL